jgi:predicted homoserine dehydrogenase-like protein
LVAVIDLSPDRAKASLSRVGWPEANYSAKSLAEAAETGATFITDDAQAVIASDHIDMVIDSTGSPAAGVHHALLCCEHRKHIITVNVEADVLAGPLLARRAAQAGIIYSMASGDQPALIAELVDWARTIGLEVVCAGKGTKHLPHLPPVHARDRVGPLRFQRGTGGWRRLQCPDVQLVPGWHQIRVGNGGCGQRL